MPVTTKMTLHFCDRESQPKPLFKPLVYNRILCCFSISGVWFLYPLTHYENTRPRWTSAPRRPEFWLCGHCGDLNKISSIITKYRSFEGFLEMSFQMTKIDDTVTKWTGQISLPSKSKLWLERCCAAPFGWVKKPFPTSLCGSYTCIVSLTSFDEQFKCTWSISTSQGGF